MAAAGEHSVTFTHVPRAEMPGDLSTVGSLGLPPGHLVVPDPGFAAERDDSGPVGWVTTGQDLRPLWAALVRDFPRTGLWPLITQGLDGAADITRPWLDGELSGRHGRPGDVVGVLHREDDEEYPSPWPVTRLAEPVYDRPPLELTPDEPLGALLLVPVTRPADAVWALGWDGAVNHDLGGAGLTTVLRSWEDRFGAVLVGLGFDLMRVVAAAVPGEAAELAALGAEHYAFCPDNIEQGAETMEAYLPEVAGGDWHFWWD